MKIEEYLHDNGIKTWKAGSKNVGKGYIGIQCPFCSDRSNHLGINLRTLSVNCFKCGSHSLNDLVRSISNVGWKEAKRIIKKIDGAETSYQKTKKAILRRIDWPPISATDNFPPEHLRDLRDCGFQPRRVISDFNLLAIGFSPHEPKYRIIAPIIMDQKIVSFTARAISKDQQPRYWTSPKSNRRKEELIYNFDALEPEGNIFIVEGPKDVWKMGKNCSIAMLGTQITNAQIKLILSKKPQRVVIIFDSEKEAQKKAKMFARRLIGCKEIISIRLGRVNDPGELSYDEVRKIRQEFSI